jgi:hypothetical protein
MGRPPKTKEKTVIDNTEKKKRGRKSEEKLSTFLITINPNQIKKENVKLLKNCVEKFYENIEDYVKLKSEKVNITKISCDSSIEKGDKRTSYHAHLLVKIFHSGKIHMDLEKLRAFLDKEIPLGLDKNVYLSVKFVNDPTFTIRQYFRKEGAK